VVVVTDPSHAREVAAVLRARAGDVHAIDTEVHGIDVRHDSPRLSGELVCFSVYVRAGAGDGESDGEGEGGSGGDPLCVWVDTDPARPGGRATLEAFRGYLADPCVHKVWHNYGFDRHVFEGAGCALAGFAGDTMHMARMHDSGRAGVRKAGEGAAADAADAGVVRGYSLESLSSDPGIVGRRFAEARSKTSMKALFQRPKLKKDGTPGKVMIMPTVRELQTGEDTRAAWVGYSALDAEATWHLYDALRTRLREKRLEADDGNDVSGREAARMSGCDTMWELYERYWLRFGEILTDMEAEGMKVDVAYLAAQQERAEGEREAALRTFREWVEAQCPGGRYMNASSVKQIQTLLFGGYVNADRAAKYEPELRALRSEVEKARHARSLADATRDGEEVVEACEAALAAAETALVKKESAARQKTEIEREREFPTSKATQNAEEDAPKKVMLRRISEGVLTPEVLTASGLPSVATPVLRQLAGTPEAPGPLHAGFGGGARGDAACAAFRALVEVSAIETLLSNFIEPLQGKFRVLDADQRVHGSFNINTETGRLSSKRPNLQNQPALEKDRYGIRRAFVAGEGNTLLVADYGQLELRVLAHIAGCESMKEAFRAGGDFHSRTALNMYPHIREAVARGECLLEREEAAGAGEDVPLVKNLFAAERRKAKTLNFSIAYGKTAHGLARDWGTGLREAEETVHAWYDSRPEVRDWQARVRAEALRYGEVCTLLGRRRRLPDIASRSASARGHAERAAINTPIQGSAADIVALAMVELAGDAPLRAMGYRMLLQVHDEILMEGPEAHAEEAQARMAHIMAHPFRDAEGGGFANRLDVELAVDAGRAKNWYQAK